jgi:hypothetical protein
VHADGQNPSNVHAFAGHTFCLQDAKQLKALMYALSSQGDLPAGHNSSISAPRPREKDEKNNDNEVAFVFTDIESSTELSQQDPNAFKQVRSTCIVCAQPGELQPCVCVLGC